MQHQLIRDTMAEIDRSRAQAFQDVDSHMAALLVEHQSELAATHLLSSVLVVFSFVLSFFSHFLFVRFSSALFGFSLSLLDLTQRIQDSMNRQTKILRQVQQREQDVV